MQIYETDDKDLNYRAKIAFIGARHPHMFHRVQVLKYFQNIEVIGFFEDDKNLAKQFGNYSGYRSFPSLESLLKEKPDLAVIEAMDDEIPDYALQAAPHTRALLLEKCSAPSYKEALRLADGLSRYPVHVEHGYELHYLEIIRDVMKILQSGVLGQITLARFHGGCPLGCGAEIWQSNPRSMGGIVYSEGSHLIELILHTLGMPEKISGRVKKLPLGEKMKSAWVTKDMYAKTNPATDVQVGGLMYEDVGAAIMEYPTMLATLDLTGWEATDWVNGWTMEYYGTNGSMVVHPYPSRLELDVAEPRAGYPAGYSYQEIPPTNSRGDSLICGTYVTQFKKVFSLLQDSPEPCQEGAKIIRNVCYIVNQIYQ